MVLYAFCTIVSLNSLPTVQFLIACIITKTGWWEGLGTSYTDDELKTLTVACQHAAPPKVNIQWQRTLCLHYHCKYSSLWYGRWNFLFWALL